MLVQNPLVVILGIGEYDGMADLVGVEKDYKNLVHAFYSQFGYSVVFMTNSNKLLYANRKPRSKNEKKLLKKDEISYKLNWTYDEVEEFTEEIVKIISDHNKNHHDGLIFLISSHGDQEGVILDSTCEEMQLIGIFDSFFGQNMPHMLDKPKMFFIDACRYVCLHVWCMF